MRRISVNALVATCAFGLGFPLARSASAEPPKKSKADAPSAPTPAPDDPNLNWKRLTLTLGMPHVQGGAVPRTDAALRKLQTPLSLCYSREILRGGRAWGTAALTLSLNADGSVSDVRVAPPQGRGLAPQLATCWSNAARGAHFDPPSTAGVVVAFEVQFSPEHGPPDPEPPKSIYSGPITILVGGLTATSGALLPDAGRVVLGWGNTLKPCAALAKGVTDPQQDGFLALFRLRITVGADGKASNPSILPGNRARPPEPDPALEKAIACVIGRTQLLQFAPRPTGESEVLIGLDFRKLSPWAAARRD